MGEQPANAELLARIKELEKETAQLNKAKEELRLAKNTLENILNNSIPLCVTNKDHEIILANEAYWATFGRPAAGDRPMKCYESRPGPSCRTEKCPMTRIQQGANEVTCETAKEGCGGSNMSMIVTARPFYNADGELVGILENFQDITVRKETERELEKSKAELQTIIDSVPSYIFIKDTQNRFEMVNEPFAQALGLPKEQLKGASAFDLFPQHIADRYWREDLEIIASGIPKTDIIENSKTPDTEAIFSTSKVPFRGTNGKIAGIIGISTDITQHKKMEEELLKAKKLEATGMLAGGIAHDFNNLLTAILGNIQLAKLETSGNKNLLMRLADAEHAAMRAKELTQKFITFSAGGKPIKKLTSIAKILSDSAMLALSGSNVTYKYSAPDALWPAEVDDSQLRQVFNNILENAKQAMLPGGEIEIEAENVEINGSSQQNGLPLPGGTYVKISFTDHGTGIAKQHLSRVFDPYFSTKEMGYQKGMGLGLTIAYSIIQKHKGHIYLRSAEGKGTTVVLYLPAYTLQEAEADTTAAAEPGRMRKILFMDDEFVVRDITRDLLAKLGFAVDLASSGEEALARYGRARDTDRPYDAVILDLTVKGGMGGEEAVKKLLEMDPDATVIVTSGYSASEIMLNYDKYGFKASLCKPFSMSKLDEVLRRAFSAGSPDSTQ